MSQETSFFCQVNHPKDPANLTDLEKKHTPVITAPAQLKAGQAAEVTVEIGKLLAHPNEPGHFIEWIDLYANYVFLARLSLTAVTTAPVLKAQVAIPHGLPKVTLRAFARCNLHGVWEATKEVAVA
jgi:superoxide reductase